MAAILPNSAAPRRCRHCAGFSLDGTATYSSVLVAGSVLRTAVESIEKRIIPCVTAVCPDCDRVSIISDGSTESMLCSIFLWQRLREWIDTGYVAEGDAVVPALEVKIEDIKAEDDGDRNDDDNDEEPIVVGTGSSAFCAVGVQ